MSKYASKVVAQAKAWLGCKESDGSHKKIIDVYNGHKPLARGYAVKYTDEWCATFVSAVAIKLGYTDIIPTECSCTQMIELLKKLGAWNESDSRKPNPGDLMFYDWQDNGRGDNKGRPDHVGIVEKVVGNTITVIEGNYSNSVKRRALKVNGKYIRGYGVPKYDTEPKTFTLTMRQLSRGCDGDDVKAMQQLLAANGYKCGDFGTNRDGADGEFGVNTEGMLIHYQCNNCLSGDGICGKKTWSKLLGLE